MVYVIKANGEKEEFDKRKVMRTCLKMHATVQQAQSVADRIESKAYDGVPTREILNLIFKFMQNYRASVKHMRDLRYAISLLRPKPDFESLVARILRKQGYEVKQNLIIAGKCVEHEVDSVARKGKELVYVEVKHHFNHHAYTGLGVFLKVQASFEDLEDGYRLSKHKLRFSKALVVCNTKVSAHARSYAECKGIAHIGWKYPKNSGLETLIERFNAYPITMIKSVTPEVESKLGDANLLTIEELVKTSDEEINKKTGLSFRLIRSLKERAKSIS